MVQDLQWISFVLKSAVCEILFCFVKCTGFYIIIIVFPVRCVLNHTTNDTKIKMMYESLSGSFSICLWYKILVLSLRAKGN